MSVWKQIVFAVFFPLTALCQSTYLPEGSREEWIAERLQIKNQSFSPHIFTTAKPYQRDKVLLDIHYSDSIYKKTNGSSTFYTNSDRYNLRVLQSNNIECSGLRMDSFRSRKVYVNHVYQTRSNFYEYRSDDLFLTVNPLLYFRGGKENNRMTFMNSRGIAVRGLLSKRLGFYSTVTDNQERVPYFVQKLITQNEAVLGVGFYKNYKEDTATFDYFDARGYICFNVMKGMDAQFGYDKNFIGNGYRSLFLSDWGNSALFLKLNTRVWKFNYQNLFMELMPQFKKKGDNLLGRKYAAMHHLSINVKNWLNVGLFEGIIFGRKDHFDYQYMNPIIFYRHIEGSVGSPDNAVAGLDFKVNLKQRIQLYGQFLMDEFIISRIRRQPTNWANKFGFQLGGKYVDAFGVKNLDLQVEANRVRPFTYSHSDSIANYTHYNQPLAHPLGANFQEIIGIVRYQPAPKWTVDSRIIYFEKGLDSTNSNFGGNIFKNYSTRSGENGFKIASGVASSCLNATLDVSYEAKYNLFIDAGVQYRTFKLATLNEATKDLNYYLALRLNFSKRKYDF